VDGGWWSNTPTGIALRSMLHRLGYRFTVNGPKNRSLPGKPDIVLPKFRTVIFVHGCRAATRMWGATTPKIRFVNRPRSE
jgi:G:T-mismatch repair DNA endonuclease (very short patch repair protein)